MTRPKTNPPIRKPVFDEEAALRFAAGGESVPVSSGDAAAPALVPGKGKGKKKEGDDGPRVSLLLDISQETAARLEAEAIRKGKSVAQVVEKLVAKQLTKYDRQGKK